MFVNFYGIPSRILSGYLKIKLFFFKEKGARCIRVTDHFYWTLGMIPFATFVWNEICGKEELERNLYLVSQCTEYNNIDSE